jgi:hypothetical protein
VTAGPLNGVSINTVPDALASCSVGEYLQRYGDDTGAPHFFTDGVADVNLPARRKRRRTSGKVVLFSRVSMRGQIEGCRRTRTGQVA